LALRGNKLFVPFQPPRPTGKSEFLEAAGFCRIWILNYSFLAKPLYEATKQGRMGATGMGRGTRKSLSRN
jgi:hypothetical protein